MKLDISKLTLENVFGDAPLEGDSGDATTTATTEGQEGNQTPSEGDGTTNPAESTQSANTQQPEQPEGEGGAEGETKEVPEAPVPVTDEIRNAFGFETDKTYSDDIPGVIELTRDYATTVAQAQLQEYFDAFPDVREYFQFRQNGGNAVDYFALQNKSADLSSFELKEDDIITQGKVLEAWLADQGYNSDQIRAKIKNYEDAGILFQEAQEAKDLLVKKTEKQKAALIQQQEEARREAERQEQETWTNIAKVVQSGQTKGIIIPDAEKVKFWEWMTKVDESGQTQRMKQREAMDTETIVALEYLAYRGLDFSKLVRQSQQTAKTQTLRERLAQNSTSPVTRTESGSDGYQKPNKTGKLPFTAEEVFGALRGE